MKWITAIIICICMIQVVSAMEAEGSKYKVNFYNGGGGNVERVGNKTAGFGIGQITVGNFSTDTFNPQEGIFYISANSTSNATAAPVGDVTDPTVTLISPTNNTVDKDGAVTFEYTPTDETALDNCSLFTNSSGVFALNKTDENPTSGSTNTITPSGFINGTYLWNVQCCDTSGNCAFADNNFTLVVNKTIGNKYFDFRDASGDSVFRINENKEWDTKFGGLSPKFNSTGTITGNELVATTQIGIGTSATTHDLTMKNFNVNIGGYLYLYDTGRKVFNFNHPEPGSTPDEYNFIVNADVNLSGGNVRIEKNLTVLGDYIVIPYCAGGSCTSVTACGTMYYDEDNTRMCIYDCASGTVCATFS